MKSKIKNFLAAIREERGATDPILVLATIAVSLILLVGGTFAVTGIITNGKDLNAKGDLDKVSIAETAYFAENDQFVGYKKGDTTAASATLASKLEKSGLGFRPTEDDKSKLGVTTAVNAAGDTVSWAAMSKSASGTIFVKTSESNLIVTIKAGTTTGAAALTELNSATPTAPLNSTKLLLDAPKLTALLALVAG